MLARSLIDPLSDGKRRATIGYEGNNLGVRRRQTCQIERNSPDEELGISGESDVRGLSLQDESIDGGLPPRQSVVCG